MNRSGSKIIGILGGMGPEATADLFLKIIRLTPACKDQDHLRVIIDSNPKIPDRTAFILGSGEDPFPALLKTALNLKKAGVDFAIMPCNTAHYFLERLVEESGLPFLSIVEATYKEIASKVIPPAKIGLLATDGTIKARIYHDVLEKRGYTLLCPSPEGQKLVMKSVYDGVKAGKLDEAKRWIGKPLRELIDGGVKAIVLGCTELPLLFKEEEIEGIFLVDSTLALAKMAVEIALSGT